MAEKKSTKSKGDAGAAEVQANMDAEQEQGFSGTKVDPTPNENYTADGVTSGKPTPETDGEMHAAAREKLAEGDPRTATEDRG